VSIEVIENKDLTKTQENFINKNRIKEFGKDSVKDFSKDYEPQTKWFFMKRGKRVVSLGGIRPLRVKYLGKNYSIGGICSTISIVKKKGYGQLMVSALIDYSKKTGKTILGFTGQTKFFKKAGLGTKKDFIKRFVWIKKNGEKILDDDGDGIYYEGKDNLISKILKTKSRVEIPVEFW